MEKRVPTVLLCAHCGKPIVKGEKRVRRADVYGFSRVVHLLCFAAWLNEQESFRAFLNAIADEEQRQIAESATHAPGCDCFWCSP